MNGWRWTYTHYSLWNTHIHIILYEIINKDSYSTLHNKLYGKKIQKRTCTRLCISESCRCPPKTENKNKHTLQHCKSPIHQYKIQITKRECWLYSLSGLSDLDCCHIPKAWAGLGNLDGLSWGWGSWGGCDSQWALPHGPGEPISLCTDPQPTDPGGSSCSETVVETSNQETKYHTGRVGVLRFITPAGPEELTL